jgi:hypothetical protein
LAGDVVKAIEPETEADPAALLIQFLVTFGNVIGRNAAFRVESDDHRMNLFAVLVGQSSKSRKGTSWGRIRDMFRELDPAWADNRIVGGLSSGEGLVWAVRDPITGREKVKEHGRITAVQEYEADPGEPDKRLLVFEAEYATVLKQTERQGNVLSAVLRQSWDSGNLRTLTKNNPAKATGAHVSIIGHITAEELKRYLSSTEAANGFGNRFLWLCVKRSKCLPEGGKEVDLSPFVERLRKAISHASGFKVCQMQRDDEATKAWARVYEGLSEGKPGLSGSLIARSEAQAMRLACVYALLDQAAVVQAKHLLAALAVVTYCEESVRSIFGDSTGDPIADELLSFLRGCSKGRTRNDLMNFLGRHEKADRIGRALGLLLKHKLARCEQNRETGGRPAERWFATSRGCGT